MIGSDPKGFGGNMRLEQRSERTFGVFNLARRRLRQAFLLLLEFHIDLKGEKNTFEVLLTI